MTVAIDPNSSIYLHPPKELTWQSVEQLTNGVRGRMLRRIGLYIHSKKQVVAALLGKAEQDSMEEKMWKLAIRLETFLYLKAASQSEYEDQHSLPQRFHSLVVSLINRHVRMAQHQTKQTHKKRALPLSLHTNSSCTLNQRLHPKKAKGKQPTNCSTDHSVGEVMMFFNGKLHVNSDVLMHVFSFMSGLETIQAMQVCKYFWKVLPKAIHSLHVSCNQIRKCLSCYTHAGAFPEKSLFARLVSLKDLSVVSLAAASDGMKTTSIATIDNQPQEKRIVKKKNNMQATKCCPQRFILTHDDHEEIIKLLSFYLSNYDFPHLSKLCLSSLFNNEHVDGEAEILIKALMKGKCSNLTQFGLPGNSIGDYGACQVSQLIASKACPRLRRLDLRKNFIGQGGLQSLVEALLTCGTSELEELLIGGNLLGDSCMPFLCDLLMHRTVVKNLQFLGIELNCFTLKSMEMLGKTMAHIASFTKLKHISYGMNSCPTAHAKNVFVESMIKERSLLKAAASKKKIVC